MERRKRRVEEIIGNSNGQGKREWLYVWKEKIDAERIGRKADCFTIATLASFDLARLQIYLWERIFDIGVRCLSALFPLPRLRKRKKQTTWPVEIPLKISVEARSICYGSN